MNTKNHKNIYLYAFMQSIPVMLGYLFLGIAFGLLLQNAGYHYIWALVCSVFVYAGSMQFVLVTLLSGGVGILYSMIMTLFINGRHIFYGLTFVEKFKNMGKLYPYMIFSLTDETYSVLCSLKVPEGMNDKKLYFLISLFDQCYWITGSVLGAVIGGLITFNTKGIDFSMTALFVVIVINQWQEAKGHLPVLVGALSGIVLLLVLGADVFLLPALTVSAVILMALRPILDKQREEVAG